MLVRFVGKSDPFSSAGGCYPGYNANEVAAFEPAIAGLLIRRSFEGGQIVRVDSQVIHQEAVKPALRLLSTRGFEGADAEFLKAHEHYRVGESEAAIVEALKSFERTLKVICTQRG